MKWLRLIRRIGRGTMGYAMSGALIFAVVGLVEGMAGGSVVALFVLPSDRILASWLIMRALFLGLSVGFTGGLLAFTIAGFIQTTRGEFRTHQPQQRYVPRDAAFWNCLRSALWASATFAVAGALTGTIGGALWAIAHPPALPFVQGPDYNIVCTLTGSGVGAAVGYLCGLTAGALVPDSVQIARRRVKEWRAKCFHVARHFKAELQR